MKSMSSAVAALALMGVMQINEAVACACCSDPGDRIEGNEPLANYTRDVLLDVRLAPTAKLYADAGFPDSVKGLRKPQDGAYRVTWNTADNRLLLAATDPSQAIGTISFPWPRRLFNLAFDPRKGPERLIGPVLHREWRLDGDATLTGIFAAKHKRAKAQLILQGEGNRCVNASDFKTWSLSLKGRDVAVKLLGKTVEK